MREHSFIFSFCCSFTVFFFFFINRLLTLPWQQCNAEKLLRLTVVSGQGRCNDLQIDFKTKGLLTSTGRLYFRVINAHFLHRLIAFLNCGVGVVRSDLPCSPVNSRDISSVSAARRSMAAVALTQCRRRALQALGYGAVRLLSPTCLQG